jgi:hypothetical protein
MLPPRLVAVRIDADDFPSGLADNYRQSGGWLHLLRAAASEEGEAMVGFPRSITADQIALVKSFGSAPTPRRRHPGGTDRQPATKGSQLPSKGRQPR